MKKTLLALLLLVTCFTLSRCHLICTDGSGVLKTETRTIGLIHEIKLDMDADVFITKGASTSLSIETDDNLLGKITTDADDGELEIKSEGCITSHQAVKIYLSVTDLGNISVTGSGRLIMKDTISTKEVSIKVSGSGSVHGKFIAAQIKSIVTGSGEVVLSGSANTSELEVSGSGTLDASQFPCNELDAKITGSGSAVVYVIQTMDAKITGSGSLHYKGKPEINSHVTGSGTLVDEN